MPEGSRGHEAESVAAAPPSLRTTSRWQKILSGLIIGYAALIVALCAWMYLRGDVGAFATILLFGPRWLCGLPLPVLTLAAVVWRRRMLWVLAIAAVVLVFPLMGFEAHWPAPADAPASFRLLTYNVDRRAADIAGLARMIGETKPDLVVLQEGDWTADYQWPKSWHAIVQDEFIVASPWPLVKQQFLPHPAALSTKVVVRFQVQTPNRTVQLFNIHLRTPRRGLEAILSRQADGADELQSVLEERAVESRTTSNWIAGFEGSKLIAGDFNMPVESVIFRRDWTWLENSFSDTGWGFGFTKISDVGRFSYRTRIDHVLYDADWQCVRSWVGEDLGSDHLPLFADFR
ncbi:MAG: endonuclease/exonuclease/phosphatase family protein [Pirellulales bacterium]